MAETTTVIHEPVRVTVAQNYGSASWGYTLIGADTGLVRHWGTKHPRPTGDWLPTKREAIDAGYARAEQMGLEVRQ